MAAVGGCGAVAGGPSKQKAGSGKARAAKRSPPKQKKPKAVAQPAAAAAHSTKAVAAAEADAPTTSQQPLQPDASANGSGARQQQADPALQQLQGSAGAKAPQPPQAPEAAAAAGSVATDASAPSLAAAAAAPPAGAAGGPARSPVAMAVQAGGSSSSDSVLRQLRRMPGSRLAGGSLRGSRRIQTAALGLFATAAAASGSSNGSGSGSSSISSSSGSGNDVQNEAVADGSRGNAHRTAGPPTQPEPAQRPDGQLGAAATGGGALDSRDGGGVEGNGAGNGGLDQEQSDAGEWMDSTCDEEVCSLDFGDD